MFNYDELYMPCWDCPYGHNCKYYSDPLWDQWIANNKDCPAKYYTVGSIYKSAAEENKKRAKIREQLKS